MYVSLDAIAQTAKEAAGEDPDRLDFVRLIDRARELGTAQFKLSDRTPE